MFSGRTLKILLLYAGIPGMLIIQFYCSSPALKEEPQVQTYAGLSDTAAYTGMNACRECHESIYKSFIETGMGKSFDASSHAKSAAEFGRHALVYDKTLNYYYHPYWDGDSLRVMEFRLQGKDTIHKRIETVSYIVGSGQHTNSHIMNTNGYLHQVPVTFYTQKGRWDLAPGFENGNNTRFRRLIGLECMTCHNAYPVFEKGSENKYEVVQQGIDCERCHGPGSVHVKLKKAGVLTDVSKEIDYSIVNPAKLPVNLQFDVCQRCHIQGNAILNEGKSFYDFRPGMKLSTVMNVFMPLYEGKEEEHIMASHAERLKQSRCYLETMAHADESNDTGNVALRPYENALTCVTCHNPHVSVRVTGKEVFNNACNKCHQAGKEHICTAAESLRKKVNNNCVQCHMPASGSTDIPHVRVTDHRIRIQHDKKTTDEIKRFVGIACINNPDPPDAAKAKAYIAYFEKFSLGEDVLDSAKKYLADDTETNITKNFPELIQLAFLKKDYPRIIQYCSYKDPLTFLNKISYTNADAWCCYRIAEAFTFTGQQAKALTYYRKTCELAPYVIDFRNKLGSSLLENNLPEEAASEFRYIIKEDPGYYQAYSNLGFIYLTQKNDSMMAGRLYDQALALNPDYENALMNKAGLYIYMQKLKDASYVLKKVIRINPKNTKAHALLKNIASN